VGALALTHNGSHGNTALGSGALLDNLAGSENTAVGTGALSSAIGSQNVALGAFAGTNLGAGHGNVYIASLGPAVLGETESDTIRIGSGQVATYVAGIAATSTGGDLVCVETDGRLGVCTPSSVHLKTEVRPMGDASERLLGLTPVTFRYREGAVAGASRLYHGLLAEEVAGLYPELARLDAEGTPVGVRYQDLPVLLLAELQRQAREVARLTAELAHLRSLLDGVRPLLLNIRDLDRSGPAASPLVGKQGSDPIQIVEK
jgi:hypothetical protein